MTTSLPIPESCSITFKGHSAPVNYVTFNSSGEYALSGSHDRTIKLWNPEAGICIKTYEGHGKEVLGICVAHDNSRFASCGSDKQVFLWDVGTGRTIRRFDGHGQRINAVAFNTEGTVLVSGSYDTTIKQSFSDSNPGGSKGWCDVITSITVRDTDWVTHMDNGNIRVYDLRMGSLTIDMISHPITSVRFSGDGNCILVSSLDGVIRLMDKDNGSLLNSFRGHQNTTYKITSCLSTDDSQVISGSEDGYIYYWDLVEATLLTKVKAHDKIVTSVAYHPRKPLVISTSVDGTAKAWKPTSTA
ncbi:1700_t:CDS:2 [Paraglomus occultum]|uniref:1700_t:CDS:1 n=1 Tax=Paraglomus occultum TaxID=144539 RepID=A0A9N9BK54_9GLOM|nr:1700_t:CDS:2 [Paraglomus occultum]